VSRREQTPLRVRWRSAALDPDSGLSAKARLCACVLAEFDRQDTGCVWPSAETIGACMGMSGRAAQDARRELEDRGWIKVERPPGQPARVYLVAGTPAGSSGVGDVTPEATPEATPAESAPEAEKQRSREAEKGVQRASRAPAQSLVAFYVDTCRTEGIEPPKRLIGQVAKQVGDLVGEGFSFNTIAEALRRMIVGQWPPTMLPSLMADVQGGPARRGRDHLADRLWRAELEAGRGPAT
jgi:hypothetical protein